tara:strand:- start:235 stop:534 length:300 start_codon:yes stop_codon:yes gene_type:complete
LVSEDRFVPCGQNPFVLESLQDTKPSKGSTHSPECSDTIADSGHFMERDGTGTGGDGGGGDGGGGDGGGGDGNVGETLSTSGSVAVYPPSTHTSPQTPY